MLKLLGDRCVFVSVRDIVYTPTQCLKPTSFSLAPTGCIGILGFSECQLQIPRCNATVAADAFRSVKSQKEISHNETKHCQAACIIYCSLSIHNTSLYAAILQKVSFALLIVCLPFPDIHRAHSEIRGSR